MEKILKTLFIISILCTLFGCSQTKDTWKSTGYIESINQFLLQPIDNKLVIIGREHHYIFDPNPSLSSVLLWDGRANLLADFRTRFEVDSNNKIKGKFSVICHCEETSEKELSWLINNGFTKTKYNTDSTVYKKSFEVTGDRYRASSTISANTENLNDRYWITINTPVTASETMKRIALTPISIASDGILVLGAVALTVIAIPLMIGDSIIN